MEGLVNTKMHCFNGFYEGKKVLITGHTGFKGGWLSLWLSELGAEVYGYALEAPTSPSLFEKANVLSVLAGHEIGDVRDKLHLKQYMMQVQPQIVFHLAAQPLVRLSYEEPVETYETNVMGTVNLLEAVRCTSSVRVCQVITSDKCYENREWAYAYRENDPMGGYDPYSNSKGCAELVVSSYRQSFFNPKHMSEHQVSLSTVRAGNVIGGGDWAQDRIIPDCIRALSEQRAIDIRNPVAIRPWQHVLEPLSGYLWLATQQYIKPVQYAEGWNFGPSTMANVSVLDVVKQVIYCWGSGQYESQPIDEKNVHEAIFLKLDIAKSVDLLGWFPVSDVQHTVELTISWYLSYVSSEHSLKSITLQQIQAYSEKAAAQGVSWAINKGVSHEQ